MMYIKQNWGVFAILIIASLPLISIGNMLKFDFSDKAEQVVSWKAMPARPERQSTEGNHQAFPQTDEKAGNQQLQNSPKEKTMLHMAVKVTGEWAIRFLVLIMSFTPFALLTRKRTSFIVRQTTGIVACGFAVLHFTAFIFDRGFLSTFNEVGLIIALITTLLMVALGLTSNLFSVKLLRNNWKKLHQLAYPVALLAIIHVILLDHGDWIPYGIILGIGFVVRLPFIKAKLVERHFKKLQVSAA